MPPDVASFAPGRPTRSRNPAHKDTGNKEDVEFSSGGLNTDQAEPSFDKAAQWGCSSNLHVLSTYLQNFPDTDKGQVLTVTQSSLLQPATWVMRRPGKIILGGLVKRLEDASANRLYKNHDSIHSLRFVFIVLHIEKQNKTVFLESKHNEMTIGVLVHSKQRGF